MAKNKRIPDQLRMACELYVSGMSWKAIAEEMGRSVHTIRRWPERYPGMWNGYIASEFNISRERAVHDAVTAARIIIHNSEDKYRVPMIGHMLRYSSAIDKNFVDARRYRCDPNKEIIQNYSRSRDNYERELVARKAARGFAPEEPKADASTNGHASNAIVMGLVLLVGMALGNLDTMVQYATSAARGVAVFEMTSSDQLPMVNSEPSCHDVAGASSHRENDDGVAFVAGSSSRREHVVSECAVAAPATWRPNARWLEAPATGTLDDALAHGRRTN